MDQSVIFTLLPQDADADGRLHAAVFVSPRLTADGPDVPASRFPAFANWPQIVTTSRVIVAKNGGGTAEAIADTSALRPDLWTTYLAPLTVAGVQPPDLSNTEIRSFPAQPILALVQSLYHAVAADSGGDHPDPFAGGLRDLGAAYLHLTGDNPVQEPSGREAWNAARRAAATAKLRADIDDRVERAVAARRDRRGQGRGSLPPGAPPPKTSAVTPEAALADPGNAVLDLAEARRFYDRPEARDPDAATYQSPDPGYQPGYRVRNDAPDFHAVLAALADHPELLRALGIVIPITLEPDLVGAGGDMKAWLEHDALDPNRITAQPWTRTSVDGRYFQPVSETGDLAHGMLLLDNSDRFDVSQLDIDSTALLVEQRIANVYPIGQQDSVPADLPALRSTGFTVTRLSRALLLEQRIARSASNAGDITAGTDIVLYAEDLVRGYRVDVHDGASWKSLMHRKVSYVDADSGAEQLTVADEAYIKASSVTQQPDAANPPAYLHEALFGWDGWSLAVPRPGGHLPAGTSPPGHPPVTTGGGDPFPGQLRLHVQSSLVKGTLPRLRYGTGYRIRARTVDLTGTSTSWPDDAHATAMHVFKRFQPVSHPVVVPRHAATEGESTLRLAVRSGVDGDPKDAGAPLSPTDPTAYTATLNAAVGLRFATFRGTAERHLVPPKIGQLDAERLGQFDSDAIGVAAAAADYRRAYARAQREQGTLLDTVVLSADDPTASVPAAGIHLVPPLALDGASTQAELDQKQAELDQELAQLSRGHAPDAGYAVIHDTASLLVPYLPDPLAAGIALRFSGSGTAAGWTHTETVPLTGTWPDIGTYRLVLAGGAVPSVTTAGNVITVRMPPGGTATVRSSSTLGQRGLGWLGMWDWIADTVPATAVPDVLAGRHQMLTPGETLTLVHATQRPLVRPSLQGGFRAYRKYDDTHTRFRGTLAVQSATTGRLDVEGRWSEWFDDPASGQPPRLVGGHTGHGFDLPVADGADQIELIGEAGAATADPRQELHDTIHRLISYTPVATTRFREYLPAQLAGDPSALNVAGPETTIHVPCSARPGAPAVHSVMPTFRWSDLPGDPFLPGARARRRHGGLRVWLERPWHISGQDEMLGVLLTGEDGIFGASDLRRQYTSLWGKDPIRRSGGLTAPVPRPRDFRGDGLVVRDRLTLAEFGQTPPGRHPGVTVVGHPVQYSEDRDLWYCDIDIDPGEASWPFLRLALARFQPWSVEGAELSPVAIADFVQLTNDRTASVLRADADTVAVTVSGIADRLLAPAILPPNTITFVPRSGDLGRGVRAWVERRGALDSDLDWSVASAAVELPRIDEDDVARVWSGTVTLPEPVDPARPGADPDGGESSYRLVVAEWETLPFDDPFADGAPVERYVYLDRFGL